MHSETDQVTPKRAELLAQLGAGSRVYAKESFSLAKKGERGWVWEVYQLSGRPGVSIVFENGSSDGFAPGEIERFILPEGSVDAEFFRSGRAPRSIGEAMRVAERAAKAPFDRDFEQVFAAWEAKEIAQEAPVAQGPSRKPPRV